MIQIEYCAGFDVRKSYFAKLTHFFRLGLPSVFPLGVFLIRVHPSTGRLNTPTDRTTNRPTGWLCLLCFAVQGTSRGESKYRRDILRLRPKVLYAATSRYSTTLLRQHAIENP